MRFHFSLIPVVVAALVAPTPAFTEEFLTLEEAQQLIFPGAHFTPADFILNAADVKRLTVETGTVVLRPQVKMWKVSSGGWFFLDQVLGRDDRITYAVGLDSAGKIKAVEILVCDEGYEQVRNPAWLRMFLSKEYRGAHLMREIPSISGATVSAAHVLDGVTRILATHSLFVAPRGG